ncbi:hypothetical protein FA13DRAFT_1716088 [Coprinellus micaceus]|uniref:Uncharacterized protein n=1 Tax=Coprinellus micaceus TaxID=71717 RepID=A0A4Y7SML3_COPMI|nr:hypothetical protein FA13DRAFT_1716088 [Coprinellus micaceus]
MSTTQKYERYLSGRSYQRFAKSPVNPFAKCRGSCAREYSGETSTLSTPTALKRPLEEPGLRSPQGDPWNRTASAEEIMRAGSHESRRVTGKELLEICLSATTMRNFLFVNVQIERSKLSKRDIVKEVKDVGEINASWLLLATTKGTVVLAVNIAPRRVWYPSSKASGWERREWWMTKEGGEYGFGTHYQQEKGARLGGRGSGGRQERKFLEPKSAVIGLSNDNRGSAGLEEDGFVEYGVGYEVKHHADYIVGVIVYE